jgi:hypothetical protein
MEKSFVLIIKKALMATNADYNSAFLTGLTGFALEYVRKNNANLQYAAKHGFLEKFVIDIIASYLQYQGLPTIGNDLDAHYIYDFLVAALYGKYMSKQAWIPSGSEQILCALIGHRLSKNFGTVWKQLTDRLPFFPDQTYNQNPTGTTGGGGLSGNESGVSSGMSGMSSGMSGY